MQPGRYTAQEEPHDQIGLRLNGSLLEFNAEPTDARSMPAHEYFAPEIVRGEGHGSADWWTFDTFLYELLHGMTPFKGNGNRATLCNVVEQPLRFPDGLQTGERGRAGPHPWVAGEGSPEEDRVQEGCH